MTNPTARIRAQFIREAVQNAFNSGIEPLPSPEMAYDVTRQTWFDDEENTPIETINEIPEKPNTAMLAAIENGIARRRA